MPKRIFAKTVFGLGLAIGACGLAAPLSAQDQPTDEDTIIVTGEGEEFDRGEVRQQARVITPRGSTIGQPLARFQQPICPGVWGLSGESAHLIIDRIYYNAELAGLRLNEEAGCTANVIVAFVPDVETELAEMAAAGHGLVSGLTFWERKRLLDQEGPVRAWNVVTTRTSDGQARSGNPPTFDTTQISRTNSGTRRDIELSMVMIDTAAIANLDGIAVADYATMRTLARTLPPRDEAAFATILALFDDPVSAPDRLTDFDRAYLVSLYSGRANTPGGMALRNVDDVMEAGVEGN